MNIQSAMQDAEAWRKANWRWLRWVVVGAVGILVGWIFL